jgi:hypothetical protein
MDMSSSPFVSASRASPKAAFARAAATADMPGWREDGRH